jgi:hypothetical protein
LRAASALSGAPIIGALLSSGLDLPQPASIGDAAFDADPGEGMRFTLGAGVGVAPDYEGSDDGELIPLWNLRVCNLYHPETFVHVLGPRLRSNFLPDDHCRLGLVVNSSRRVLMSRTIGSTIWRTSTRR